jgi:hypothetical protein
VKQASETDAAQRKLGADFVRLEADAREAFRNGVASVIRCTLLRRRTIHCRDGRNCCPIADRTSVNSDNLIPQRPLITKKAVEIFGQDVEDIVFVPARFSGRVRRKEHVMHRPERR